MPFDEFSMIIDDLLEVWKHRKAERERQEAEEARARQEAKDNESKYRPK